MCTKIIHFDTIDSTNTYGLSNFFDLDDKTVVVSKLQTKGRGRFDRVWVSDDYDNIYMSLILKPIKIEHVANLTQYLSVVVANVISEYSVNPEIKYPNDVLINGKKICGILCESVLKKNRLQGVVLGVGVNLNMPEEIVKTIDRPATSLNLHVGRKVNRQEFLNKLLSVFFADYEKVLENGFLSFADDYLSKIKFLGKPIYVQQRDGAPKEPVTALRIDTKGNLVVKTQQGEEKIVYSGDILLS